MVLTTIPKLLCCIPVILVFHTFKGIQEETVFKFFVISIPRQFAVIANPLHFGFGISLDSCVPSLARRSFFHRQPRHEQPFCSLNKVLHLLQLDKYCVNPSLMDVLHKALFLLTLATGFRASQLRALTRHPNWTVLTTGNSHVCLAPAPND